MWARLTSLSGGLDVSRPAAPLTTDAGAPGRQRAIVFGTLTAVYLLTRLALLSRLPYFIDEGTHAQFAYHGAHSLHDLFISLTIGKEPLSIWVAVVWIKLGFAPLTAVRLASLLSGALTVPIVGMLGARVGGDRVGFVAAAGCVVLPFFLVHDVIGIMEPLLTLLMAAALYLQIALARRPRLSLGILLGLVLGASLLTKESGELALALLPLSLLCLDWHAPGRRHRLLVWVGAAAIALVLTVAADLLLRSSAYYGRLAAVRRSSFLYPVRSWHDALVHPLSWWHLAWPIYRSALVGYVGVPLLCAALVGAVLMWRDDRRVTLLLSGWIAAMFGAAVLFPVSPYPRHVLYLVPLLVVFAARTIVFAASWVAGAVPNRWAARLIISLGVALLLLSPLWLDARVLHHPVSTTYPGRDDVQYVTGPQGGAEWPAVAAAIRRRATGAHTIVASDRADTDVVQLLLGHASRYVFVDGSAPSARRAQFILKDELPFPNPTADRLIQDGGFRLLARLPRPRGGAVVELYERPPPP
jgi:4-amino-4-deoxy-L-arabinose transferase-like glycosyltransferase